ncbi:hypothetical protein [Streptococcus salivarius]|uniref:hypothetical protein n=1 Tax=Streptococcus salivarius TaxID=1304 RepID=UPI000DA34DFF|nr:hypothetical protein [Streptococcus salivarius]SQF75704.1 Uncharacterised protein [Streptococcus salivarius]
MTDKYLVYRGNLNYYYDKEKSLLSIISSDRYINISCDIEQYQIFRDIIREICNKDLKVSCLNKKSEFEKKIIQIINYLKGFALTKSGFPYTTNLGRFMLKMDDNPIEKMEIINSINFKVINKLENLSNLDSRLMEAIREFGFTSELKDIEEKKTETVILCKFSDLHLEQIVYYDYYIIESKGNYYFVKKEVLKRNFHDFCEFVKNNSIDINSDFTFNVYHKLFPYFLSQCLASNIDNNMMYFDENMFPQYVNFTEEKLEDLIVVEENLEKFGMDQFPKIDSAIKKLSSFIKSITLLDSFDEYGFFKFRVTLKDGNMFDVVGRTYELAFEQAILLSFEHKYHIYLFSTIGSQYYPSNVFTRGRIINSEEFFEKIKNYYQLNNLFSIQCLQNKDSVVVKTLYDGKVISIDFDSSISNIEKVIERSLSRGFNRLNAGMSEIIIKECLYRKKIYEWNSLPLFSYSIFENNLE